MRGEAPVSVAVRQINRLISGTFLLAAPLGENHHRVQDTAKPQSGVLNSVAAYSWD